MTLEEFKHPLDTDREYRAHLVAANRAGTLTEEEAVYLIDVGWGAARMRLHDPWVIAQLLRELSWSVGNVACNRCGCAMASARMRVVRIGDSDGVFRFESWI